MCSLQNDTLEVKRCLSVLFSESEVRQCRRRKIPVYDILRPPPPPPSIPPSSAALCAPRVPPLPLCKPDTGY